MKQIGEFTKNLTDLLELDISPGTPILIGESNVEHIKNRHPYEFDKYMGEIENIISQPDYVGISPKDNSVLFVKLYKIEGEYIRVAVRVTSSGKYFAKTLHLLSTSNAERYIEKGTLKKVDNSPK